MSDPFRDDPDLEAWRQAYRALQGPGSLACPRDDELIALVLNEVDARERERLADHLVQCQQCTDTYRLLVRLYPGAAEAPSEGPAAKPPPPETSC
jgi:hypothetical protein